jgi:superfamily II DNA/RNA helicase
MLNLKENSTQVLVLSPTRELTVQTANVMTSLGCMMKGLKVQTLFGGSQYIAHDEVNNDTFKKTIAIVCL